MGADAEVVVLGGGAQARVRGEDTRVEERGHDAAAVLQESGDALGGGVVLVLRVLPPGEVFRGGAEQYVAEDGGRDEDALAESGRYGQQDVPDEGPGLLGEDQELAAARGDGEVVDAEEAVDVVGVEAGGVDEEAGAEGAAGGVEEMPVRVGADPGDTGAQAQFDSGTDRLGGVREGGGPGVDDALVRDFERAEGAGAEVGFAGADLGGGEEPGGGVPVGGGLGGEGGQGGEFVLVPGDEERTGLLDRDTGLCGVVEESALARRAADGIRGSRGWRRKPVWRMAVLAFDVRCRRRRSVEKDDPWEDRRASSRAMAVPTTPAPMTARS
ncbi:hypothetical protein GCM10018987_20150 [Streptomyces cremeus]